MTSLDSFGDALVSKLTGVVSYSDRLIYRVESLIGRPNYNVNYPYLLIALDEVSTYHVSSPTYTALVNFALSRNMPFAVEDDRPRSYHLPAFSIPRMSFAQASRLVKYLPLHDPIVFSPRLIGVNYKKLHHDLICIVKAVGNSDGTFTVSCADGSSYVVSGYTEGVRSLKQVRILSIV